MLQALLDEIVGFTPIQKQAIPQVEKLKFVQDALFDGLTASQITTLKPYLSECVFQASELIVKEGEKTKTLYLINRGKVEVFKQVKEGTREHTLAVLEAGECFGEISLFDDKSRSASIRALTETQVQMLTENALQSLAKEHPLIHSILSQNLCVELSSRLRNTNEITVKSLENSLIKMQERVKMGIFMTYVILLLSIYTLMNSFSDQFSTSPTTRFILNLPFLVFAATIIILMLGKLPFPIQIYGLSLKSSKKPLVITFVSTALFIALLVVIKILLVNFSTSYSGQPIFLNPIKDLNLSEDYLLLIGRFVNLAAFIPLQELIIRSGLQSSLMQFLPNTRYFRWISIIITTVVFTALHSGLSPNAEFSFLLPGFFLSLLYARTGSLISVCIAHFLIGIASYYFLGFHDLTLPR